MEGRQMEYETEGTLTAEDAAALTALAEAAAADEALAEALADAQAEAAQDASQRGCWQCDGVHGGGAC